MDTTLYDEAIWVVLCLFRGWGKSGGGEMERGDEFWLGELELGEVLGKSLGKREFGTCEDGLV